MGCSICCQDEHVSILGDKNPACRCGIGKLLLVCGLNQSTIGRGCYIDTPASESLGYGMIYVFVQMKFHDVSMTNLTRRSQAFRFVPEVAWFPFPCLSI